MSPGEVRGQDGPGLGRMAVFREGEAVFRSGIPVMGTGWGGFGVGSEVNAES